MNADEIVMEARGLHTDWVVFESMHHGGGQGAKSDDGEAKRKFMLWLVDDFPVMCDLIESLQAQLNGSQNKLRSLREAIKVKGGTEHYPTEEAYLTACAVLEKTKTQLSASQRREKAAVEDFTSAAHNGNILCEFCGADCIDAGNDTGGDTCQCGGFEWRGPQETGEGERDE